MKFVSYFRYTAQGVANYKQTTKRAKDFIKQAKAAGVHVQEILWTQGRFDGLMICDAPDAETVSALALGLASRGNIQTETTHAFDLKAMEKIVGK